MIKSKIIVSGTGCALADYLYNGISFNSKEFIKFQSKKPGDGGLSPGKLVFTGELEKYSNLLYQEIKGEIIGGRPPDNFNVGGPSLVPMIHAAQLLNEEDYKVNFYGIAGNDKTAEKILRIVRNTNLDIKNYKITKKRSTPFTDVLSDPEFDNGNGERTFINNLGAALDYSLNDLGESFYNSNIVCFGGTALVPALHKNITALLARAKKGGCITIVNTVFDFISEKKDPDKPWQFGNADLSFNLIDVLIMDYIESLRISGRNNIDDAISFFINSGVSSFIITNGADLINMWSSGRFFNMQGRVQLPVSEKVTELLKKYPETRGDTTGCGDNFAGGIIASIAWQTKNKVKGEYDFFEALSWGVASGGFACFTLGGTYNENSPGEKLSEIRKLQQYYLSQINKKDETLEI